MVTAELCLCLSCLNSTFLDSQSATENFLLHFFLVWFYLILNYLTMISQPQAEGLALFSHLLPPQFLPHWTGLTSGMLVLLFLAHLNWVSPEVPPERWKDDPSTNEIKYIAFFFSLDACNCVRVGRAWLTSHSHGGGAGVWRTSMSSSSLSECSVCCSLTPSVTPQSAVDTHSPLMHLSILALLSAP